MVYDIGCGDGLFLESISRLGLQVGGFEPEAVPRKQAEQRLQMKLDAALRPQSSGPRISAITCWQVIEHVEDPQKLLQTIRGLLSDGGLLALSTVNRDALQAKIFGTHWLHLDPPRHRWIGSRNSVIKMIEAAGFQVIQVSHRPLEFGPIGWVDSLLNFFDFERDRLLRCLKQGVAKPFDRWICLLAAALTPWAVILSLLESVFGHPATFEIYARLEKRGARRQGG